MRTLVLGLGNTLLSDDAVAIEVVRRLGERLATCPGIDVAESALSGLALIDTIIGYDRVFILDAVPVGDGAVGQIKEIELAEMRAEACAVSPHFTGVASLLGVAEKMGYLTPQIRLFGIGVREPLIIGEGLSPGLDQVVPRLVDEAAGLLGLKKHTARLDGCTIMHELAIAESIVKTVYQEIEQRGLASVQTVGVHVGALSGIVSDALAFSYSAITIDTPLQDTRLVIEEIPARARCRGCSFEFEVEDLYFACPDCSSGHTEMVAGQELDITYLEVE